MSGDGNAWGPVGVPSDVVGTLAVRVVRDVAKALGLDLEHARAADIAPAVAALRARVAELEAERRWVPVTERLPAHGVKVEGFDEVDGQFIGRFGLRGWRAEHGAMSAYRTFDRVTHWRPLPSTPEVPR